MFPSLWPTEKSLQAQLDDDVRPILEAKFRLFGLFDHPYVDESKVEAVLNRQSSRALERQLAARSMVLLRNENQALPLAKSVKKIAVIGPLADAPQEIEGGWTVEALVWWVEQGQSSFGRCRTTQQAQVRRRTDRSGFWRCRSRASILRCSIFSPERSLCPSRLTPNSNNGATRRSQPRKKRMS